MILFGCATAHGVAHAADTHDFLTWFISSFFQEVVSDIVHTSY